MTIVSDRLDQIATVLAEFGVGNGDGGAQLGDLLYAGAYLDDARIKTLQATDYELVDAPGEGLAIYPVRAMAILDQSNGAYDVGDASPDYAEIAVGFADYWTTALQQWFVVGTDVQVRGVPESGAQSLTAVLDTGGGVYDLALIENVPLCVGNTGTIELGGGGEGNSLTIRVYYHIVPAAPMPA